MNTRRTRFLNDVASFIESCLRRFDLNAKAAVYEGQNASSK